ncbi:MAG: DUF5979 domain-containing protein, partial [Lachnospiraceae bacterium]|nr:DUF5979 domain-containing protein [Lachnospiraceae bacterium]
RLYSYRESVKKKNGGEAMKNKKIVKKLFAGVMALSLCLGTTGIVAVAAPEDEAAKTAAVSLTKELDIAEGIQTPEVTFTFNFVQDKAGSYKTQTGESLPVTSTDYALDSVKLMFTSEDQQTDGKIVKESKNILANVEFPTAGVYKYTVTEVAGDASVANDNGKGTMTYDTTTYNMFVVVKNGNDGKTVIDNVIVEKEGEEGAEDVKVNPAPTTDKDENTDNAAKGDDTNAAANGEGNSFRFVNTYTKTTGEEPEEPIKPGKDDTTASALKVSKTVVGDMADLTQEFSFAITLNYPETAKDVAKEITAYRVDKDGIVKETLEFKEGTANPFKLSDGEYISFKELPAGTTYVVKETGTTNYTGSIITTSNNNAAAEEKAEKSANLVASKAVVGEMVDGNSAAVTNTYDDQSATPTGIIVNNLPYVALLLVAVVGCVVIFAGRKRRSN